MKFTAQQIATLVQGNIDGDPQAKVQTFAKIEEGKEGDLCFLANGKYEDFLYDSKASVVLISNSLELRKPVSATLIRVEDPYAAFAILLQTYQDLITEKPKSGIDPHSMVSEDVKIDETVYIGAFTYISKGVRLGKDVQIHPSVYIGAHVSIGDNTIIHPGVVIYQGCIIGSHCIIHSGTVVGSDGFGFAPENGEYRKIPQLGSVEIDDYVEIGANCTIDRATLGTTRIGKGVKLDNLIQIAHNVEIGDHTVMASQSGVSGSTKLGKFCMVGGQAGVVGHIRIADGTRINAQSGVSKSIPKPNQAVTGSPAFNYQASLRSQVALRQFPEALKRINDLERELAAIRELLSLKATQND